MKQILIFTLLTAIVFCGLGSTVIEAKGKNNNCSFYIHNDTEGKIAVQTFDAAGIPMKMVEISRNKKKMFKNMSGMTIELSSKPHKSRQAYMPFGQFTLTKCPDMKITFPATDFMNFSSKVSEYFTTNMMVEEVMMAPHGFEDMKMMESPEGGIIYEDEMMME